MKEAGYLDDGQFAMSLRRAAEEQKLLGLDGARAYLLRMGISNEAAGNALEGYDEYPVAERLLRKKLGSLEGQPAETVRRRLYALFKRKGYSNDTVRRIMKEAYS